MALTGTVGSELIINIKLHSIVSASAFYKVRILDGDIGDYTLGNVYGYGYNTWTGDKYPGGLRYQELDFNGTNYSINQPAVIIPNRAGTINVRYAVTANYTLEQKFGVIQIDVDDITPDTFVEVDVPFIGARFDDTISPEYIWQRLGIYRFDATIPDFTPHNADPNFDIIFYLRKPDGSFVQHANNSGVWDTPGVYDIWCCNSVMQVDRSYWKGVSTNPSALQEGFQQQIDITDSGGVVTNTYSRLYIEVSGRVSNTPTVFAKLNVGSLDILVGSNSAGARAIPSPTSITSCKCRGFDITNSALPINPTGDVSGTLSVVAGGSGGPTGQATATVEISSGTFTPTHTFYVSVNPVIGHGDLTWHFTLKQGYPVPVGLPTPLGVAKLDYDAIPNDDRNQDTVYHEPHIINSSTFSPSIPKP